MSSPQLHASQSATDAPHSNVTLRARELTRVYRQGDREIEALRGVDLEVGGGEFIALMGPSGSGKSTLLHLLGALDQPTSGEVVLENTTLATLSKDELAIIRRRRLGFVFQFFSLFPTMTALENTAFPLMIDGADDANVRAQEQLEAVGLANRATHRPGQLSGGEQQRVALARALITQPAVLLADEPTGNLDSASGTEVLRLLRAGADRGQATIVATHDPNAAGYADRIISLRDGEVAG